MPPVSSRIRRTSAELRTPVSQATQSPMSSRSASRPWRCTRHSGNSCVPPTFTSSPYYGSCIDLDRRGLTVGGPVTLRSYHRTRSTIVDLDQCDLRLRKCHVVTSIRRSCDRSRRRSNQRCAAWPPSSSFSFDAHPFAFRALVRRNLLFLEPPMAEALNDQRLGAIFSALAFLTWSLADYS
jgi:hypothetical protein